MFRASTQYRRSVVDYWDGATELYLSHTQTFQGGLLNYGFNVGPRANNLAVSARAGIVDGMRILDAGCGVCGPSRAIAEAFRHVTISAITVSEVQRRIGAQLVRESGLASRIDVTQADFHSLPYESQWFDTALFLESFGYSDAPLELSREIWRILRSGGRIYIKDVFVDCRLVAATKQSEVAEFQSRYRYRASCLCNTVRNLEAAGFVVKHVQDLTRIVDRTLAHRYMFERCGRVLSPLGKMHFTGFTDLGIRFAEILAIKPAISESSQL